jgi:hypothetical protein
VNWASTAGRQSFDGVLWELDAVELRARPPAPRAAAGAGLEAPERAVLAQEQVSEAALRAWLVKRDLALVVTRDQTSRDRADLQQPFNLQVPGGVRTVSKTSPGGKVYDIAHLQFFQADQVRAYPGRPGRRVIAQPMHDAEGANPVNLARPVNPVKPANPVNPANPGQSRPIPAGRPAACGSPPTARPRRSCRRGGRSPGRALTAPARQSYGNATGLLSRPAKYAPALLAMALTRQIRPGWRRRATNRWRCANY